MEIKKDMNYFFVQMLKDLKIMIIKGCKNLDNLSENDLDTSYDKIKLKESVYFT